MPNTPAIRQGDCLEVMKTLANDSVDLVFTSPPYEDARTYGIDYKLKDDGWVSWAIPRFEECLRVSRGLVAWVVEGKTRRYRYSLTPMKLMLALNERGYCVRKPPVFHRVGIPGSGGPDWLRNDYEFIVCATRERGRLPWSDNKAMGSPPKHAPGGPMSHRMPNGRRVLRKTTTPGKDGYMEQGYSPPAKTNPGNVLSHSVGGGKMGHPLAHENEAPFPLALAEFFVRSFAPPDGTVLDPFVGSGTTLQACAEAGRNGLGIDLRESQVGLSARRLAKDACPFCGFAFNHESLGKYGCPNCEGDPDAEKEG